MSDPERVGPAAAEVAAGARTAGGRRKELEKVMYRLEQRQISALRAEAFKRAAERGSGKPDASEVLREVLDAWLVKRAK